MPLHVKFTLILGTILGAVLTVLVVGTLRETGGTTQPVANGTESKQVRGDGRVLGTPGSSDVTVVVFTDFECGACAAAFPLLEQVRADYAGEVTFVVRYFPLPGNFNSRRAARTIEAAGRQGKFEEMYLKLFETRDRRKEQRTAPDVLFRGFAEAVDLDLQRFDVDYRSASVRDRVQRDFSEGQDLGVLGTPTFFLDGRQFQPQSVEDFYDTIDEALAQ